MEAFLHNIYIAALDKLHWNIFQSVILDQCFSNFSIESTDYFEILFL